MDEKTGGELKDSYERNTVRFPQSWEIPTQEDQARWFWRGRQGQWFEESCSFPAGKNLRRQCLNAPGYGPDELFCKTHAPKAATVAKSREG